MASVQIEDVRVSDGGKRLEPIKIRFSHCLNPVKSGNVSALKSGIFSDPSTKNNYVGVCQVGSMYYMGTTKVEQPEETQRQFIALRKKSTNKVTLVEVSSMPLFPIVQYPSSTNPLLLSKDDQDSVSSKQEISKDFVHRFGMLRGQRIYDQRERLTVRAETLRENLDNAAVETMVEINDLVVPKKDDSYAIMPPRNSNAKLASDVFLIDEIIPKNQLEDLKDSAKRLLTEEFENLEEKTDYYFSSYFIDEFTLIKNNRELDKEVTSRHLAALLFIECLIKLATVKPKTFIHVLEEYLPSLIPDSVKHGIKANFITNKDGMEKGLSKISSQKVTCHILALALIIGSCGVDAESLSSSLKMEMDKLKPLVQEVGARFITDKTCDKSRIILTIPLAKPRRIGGRKK